MAFTMRKNIINKLSKRNYSADVAPKSALAGEHTVKTSTLKNNIPLLSINESHPVSRVTIAFRSGSRYEKTDNVGATNIIRSSVGLGTKHFTKFGIVSNLDLNGVSLHASDNREIVSYTLEGLRDKLPPLLVYLASIAINPDFKPWELRDNISRIKFEHSSIPHEVRAIDALHKAAYRTGLGNSLFTSEYKLSSFTQDDLKQYYNSTFTANRTLIAGYGIDYELLKEFGDFVEIPGGSAFVSEPAKFYGGDERFPVISHVTHVAVAGEAPGFTKKESAAYGVLSYIYGSRPPLKYSASGGLISQAVSKFGPEFSVNPINISYPDSGLVGFLISAPSEKISEVYQEAVGEFLKSKISDKDVAKGKAKLKAEFLSSIDLNSGLLDFFINQLGHSTVLTPTQVVSTIDSVTAADVKQAAKKITSGNLAIGVAGKVDNVPYLSTVK